MKNDRTELNDLASHHEEKVNEMIGIWKDWAKRCGVKLWPLNPIPEGEKDWSNLPWMW
jgi:glycosidase